MVKIRIYDKYIDINHMFGKEVKRVAGLKVEVTFGLDPFQQPEKLSFKDSIAQIVINMFLMRPGNLPSLPHIGINISQYLYVIEEELDVENLKRDIYNQASELLPFVAIGDIQIFITPVYDVDTLIVVIPINYETETSDALMIGFQNTSNGNDVVFNYQFQENFSNLI